MQVAAIQSIDSQLDRFAAEMESDGAVQHARVRKLLDAELERAAAAVSSTLQLSNITSLSSYIFGGDSKKISELPIATVRFVLLLPWIHMTCVDRPVMNELFRVMHCSMHAGPCRTI
jgi:hypothetical protein